MKSWVTSTVGLARRRRGRLVVVDEERADQTAAEVGERQPLRLERLVGIARADDEVDQRQLGVSAVDRQRRDASTDDDREGEEPLADDLAERLERPDPLPDALEPSVRPDGFELEFAGLGVGHRRETVPFRASIGSVILLDGKNARTRASRCRHPLQITCLPPRLAPRCGSNECTRA